MNDDVTTVNRTSRGAGAIGANAVVPKLVREVAGYTDTILDYGAGKALQHTRQLRATGFNSVTAYDIGANVTAAHDTGALQRQYDVVFASNVLNVSPNVRWLTATISQIRKATLHIAVVNYPASPRKCEATLRDVKTMLQAAFAVVEQRGKAFICYV